MSGPCAGDSEDALRFLQQQHMRDSTLVSSVYLDDPDFQTYRSRYSSAALLALCSAFAACNVCPVIALWLHVALAAMPGEHVSAGVYPACCAMHSICLTTGFFILFFIIILFFVCCWSFLLLLLHCCRSLGGFNSSVDLLHACVND